MSTHVPGLDLLTGLLRDVSRSFYLTLRVLPAAVRRPIGLAYLLARATDTIADTTLVPVAQRLNALKALSDRIQGHRAAPVDFAEFLSRDTAAGTPDGERQLLARIEEGLSTLAHLAERDRADIRTVLATITSGQTLDLQRFGQTSGGSIGALPTGADLTDYTYRVAGCVGEFWTRLCRRHLFPAHPLDDTALLADGIRFGQGLQLVNILRDLPKDLRSGRCYVPLARLGELGLTPPDLLKPETETRFRPLYHQLLAEAEGHLTAGWRYTNALPRNQRRLRLACAWPLLIGRETLARLRAVNILEANQRVKVTRADIRRLLFSSLWRLPFPRAWARLWPE